MKVLVALDESPVSTRAARSAVSLFSRVPDAEFLVINVAAVPTAWAGGVGYGWVGPMMIDPRWLDQPAEAGEDEERRLVAAAEREGVPDPEPVLRSGDPVAEICAAAEEVGADVIVVGSHDKSALQRIFDPSIASAVVRGTARPVLVVSGE
jgi:nucleotide-binding universal stress UspA family protein